MRGSALMDERRQQHTSVVNAFKQRSAGGGLFLSPN
jgi:hypothetical protein